MSEETGAEVRHEQNARDENVELSAAEEARLAWTALPTSDKVKTLVTLGLTAVGAVSVLRRGGRLVRAGYRRARR